LTGAADLVFLFYFASLFRQQIVLLLSLGSDALSAGAVGKNEGAWRGITRKTRMTNSLRLYTQR